MSWYFVPKDYTSEINAWRADMEERLQRPYSWLALAGLYWLQEGENAFGSAAENPVRLPQSALAQTGVFTLAGGEVSVSPAAGVEIMLNDKPLAAGTRLHNDHAEKPDFLFIGDIRILVIQRGDKLAIRIWDPQHPNRQNFAGRAWWPVDPDARVTARVKRYDPPKHVMIDDIVGIQQPGVMHAALHFEWRGQHCSLDAELLDDGSYDLLFKDATAGKGSYPAGRFLTTEVAEGNQVVLDFNKAYSPPCAFTEFATCPLPMPQNILSAAIEAGEKFADDHSPQRH